jgi:hypothetical protein
VPTDSLFYNSGRITGDVAAGILGIAEIMGGSGLGGGGLAACGTGGGCVLTGPAIAAGSGLIAHGILVTGSGAINLGRDLTNFFAQENERAGNSGAGTQGDSGSNPGIGDSAGKANSPRASEILDTSLKQLQKKFKHAVDFGVEGNYNKENAAKFNSAINQHVNAPDTQTIQGTYRNANNPVIFYLNKKTGLNVISSPTGEFISGAKLNNNQVSDKLKKRFLW